MSILKLPLIVWIDDNHDSAEHNMYAKKAKDLGVHLVLVDSTAEAKLWIIENLGITFQNELLTLRFPVGKQFRLAD